MVEFMTLRGSTGYGRRMAGSATGTARSVGVINPITQAISEFSAGLNAGSIPS